MLTQLLSFSMLKRHLQHWNAKDAKMKSEIMKHHQKDHIFFFILNRRSWVFKTLLEKAKLTSMDSSSDKQKALIRNVATQPLSEIAK